jgi:NAD(P)-dependent dehydrogenase (short-subunit alcohol dehydrogenase family)
MAQTHIHHLVTLYKVLQTTHHAITHCYLVTKGALPVQPGPLNLAQSPISGFFKSCYFELINIQSRHIDLDPQATDMENVTSLYQAIRWPGDELQLAYRLEQRYVNRLVRYDRATSHDAVTSSGSYLITGGLGGAGLKLAEHLSHLGARHLVLMGRTPPKQEQRTKINQLIRQGVQVEFVTSDVSDYEQVQKILLLFGREWPALRGIIHAAGVLSDGLLINQSADSIRTVFLPKVSGAWNLHQVCLQQNIPLDFFIMFSSLASVIGSPGQSNYAAANAFLDALAHYRCQMGLVATSINWGTWEQAGMAVDLKSRHQFYGIDPLNEAMALSQVLSSEPIQPVIATINWQEFLNQLAQIPSWLQAFRYVKHVRFDLLRQLEHTPPGMKLKVLRQFLRQAVAEVMEFAQPETLSDTIGFFELGLDSLMAVDLHKTLQLALGDTVSLSSTLVFDYPSLDALTTKIASLLSIPTKVKKEDDKADFEEMSLNDLINLIDE